MNLERDIIGRLFLELKHNSQRELRDVVPLFIEVQLEICLPRWLRRPRWLVLLHLHIILCQRQRTCKRRPPNERDDNERILCQAVKVLDHVGIQIPRNCQSLNSKFLNLLHLHLVFNHLPSCHLPWIHLLRLKTTNASESYNIMTLPYMGKKIKIYLSKQISQKIYSTKMTLP